jgi:stearoyl-CoA desaturase (delta-9 desaturase)
MLFYALACYLLGVLGVNLGYHRMLSHRAVRLPRWLARICVVLGLPAGTPVQWAGNHRYHHAHADTALDPHAPRKAGFWYAHCGWYYGIRWWPLAALYALLGPLRMLVDAWLRPRAASPSFAADVASDPFYASLSRPGIYALAMHLHFAAAVGSAWAIWGSAGLWLSWGTFVLLYNIGDAIDSLAHDRHSAINRPWLAILSAGEGWHIQHHRYPGSPKCGLEPGQLDLTWQIIRVLEKMGWAEPERRWNHERS